MQHKTKRKTWQTALALLTIGLAGCSCGSANSKSKMQVTPDFLDRLIEEQPGVARDYPATASVVDDWIVQNEPQ